jgi:hypothetical protein
MQEFWQAAHEERELAATPQRWVEPIVKAGAESFGA